MSPHPPRGYLEISTWRPDMVPLVFDCASIVPKKAGWNALWLQLGNSCVVTAQALAKCL